MEKDILFELETQDGQPVILPKSMIGSIVADIDAPALNSIVMLKNGAGEIGIRGNAAALASRIWPDRPLVKVYD